LVERLHGTLARLKPDMPAKLRRPAGLASRLSKIPSRKPANDQNPQEDTLKTPGTQYSLFESVEAIPVEQSASEPAGRRFSDYVVYVDESGDHSLASIDRDYPVFVLALCVFHKRHYAEKIVPAVHKLKFNYLGHDCVVLH